jgi:hypothetical protein
MQSIAALIAEIFSIVAAKLNRSVAHALHEGVKHEEHSQDRAEKPSLKPS